MTPRKFTILNFHGIGRPHSGVDAGEARYWITRARFNRILDLIQSHQAAGHSAMITFDDGNRSDVEVAVPELRARGLKGYFFVLTGRCDDPRYLSPAEIHELANGEMTVGLHGRDHIDWCKLDSTQLSEETEGARQNLSAMTGQPIDAVGIPFGSYNRRVIASLKRAGYNEIYTSDGGQTSPGRRIHHRCSIREDMSDEIVSALLSGKEHPAQRLKRSMKAWLKEHIVA